MSTSSPLQYRKLLIGANLPIPPQPLQRPEDVPTMDPLQALHIEPTKIPVHYWRLPSSTVEYINGIPTQKSGTEVTFPSELPHTEDERDWLSKFTTEIADNILNRASYLNITKEGDIRFVLHSLNTLHILCLEVSRHLMCITLDKSTYPYSQLGKALATISHAFQGLIDNLVHYAEPDAKLSPLLQDLSNFHRYTGFAAGVAELYSSIREAKITDIETSTALIADLERRLDEEKEAARKRETELEHQIASLKTEIESQRRNIARLELDLNAARTIRSSLQPVPVAPPADLNSTLLPSALSTSTAQSVMEKPSGAATAKQAATIKVIDAANELITTNIYSSFSPAPISKESAQNKICTQDLATVYTNMRTISAQKNACTDDAALLRKLSDMTLSSNNAGEQMLGEDGNYTIVQCHTSGSQRLPTNARRRIAEQGMDVDIVPTTLEVTNYRGTNEINRYSELTGTPQRSSAIFQTIGSLLATQNKDPTKVAMRPKTAPEPEVAVSVYKGTQEIGPKASNALELTKMPPSDWNSGVVDLQSLVSGRTADGSRRKSAVNNGTAFLDSATLSRASNRCLGYLTSLDEDDAWRLEANLGRQVVKNPDATATSAQPKCGDTPFSRQPHDDQAFLLLNPACPPHDKAVGELDLSYDKFRLCFQLSKDEHTKPKPAPQGFETTWTDKYLQQYMPYSATDVPETIAPRPLLLSSRTSSLPTILDTPDTVPVNKCSPMPNISINPLSFTDGRHIPVLTRARRSQDTNVKMNIKDLSSSKTLKPNMIKISSTPELGSLSQPAAVYLSESTKPGPSLTKESQAEVDATFSKMIAINEKDLTATIADPFAHSVKCRTLYSKTRAELHHLYKTLLSKRNLNDSGISVDSDSDRGVRIFLRPQFITRHTTIIDALLGTKDGLRSIPFIKNPAYLEAQYGRSEKTRETLEALTRKLFCSDCIFSFTSTEQIFTTLNDRLSTVPLQETRSALWCDFLQQWNLALNCPTDKDTKDRSPISGALNNLCCRWDSATMLKALLCYKFEIYTPIRASTLYNTKGMQQEGPVSVVQMLLSPGALAGASKLYFLGLAKSTQLYKLIKPAFRVFCIKVEQALARSSSSNTLKSTGQVKINVEEDKGISQLRTILHHAGYVLLDLRTVLSIIHEVLLQRHASYEPGFPGFAPYVPMDKFIFETFFKENNFNVDKTYRAVTSFLISIQAYILCDNLPTDDGSGSTSTGKSPRDQYGDDYSPLSAKRARTPGLNIDRRVRTLDTFTYDDSANRRTEELEAASEIVQCNEFLLVFLELLSSQDHLSTEYICYAYMQFYNFMSPRYPYPYVSLDSVLILSRRLLAELPKPYYSLLCASFKQLAKRDKYDAPTLNIGTVLRILGAQKRMVRAMLQNSIYEEYERVLSAPPSLPADRTNTDINDAKEAKETKELAKSKPPEDGEEADDPAQQPRGPDDSPVRPPPSVVAKRREQALPKKSKTAYRQKRDAKAADELKPSSYADMPITYQNFVTVLTNIGCILAPMIYSKCYCAAMWAAAAERTDPSSSSTLQSAPDAQVNLGLPTLKQILNVLPYTAHVSFPHLFYALSRKSKFVSVQRLHYGYESVYQNDMQALVSRYMLSGDQSGHIKELQAVLKTVTYELESPVKRLVSMLTCEANGLAYNLEPFYISSSISNLTSGMGDPLAVSNNKQGDAFISSISYTLPPRRHLSVLAIHILTLYTSIKATLADNSLPDETLVETVESLRSLMLQMHQAYQSLRPFNCNLEGLLYELQDRLQGIERCDTYICANLTTDEVLRETLGVENVHGPLARILGMARNSIYLP